MILGGVALLVSAWIEIEKVEFYLNAIKVALLVSAWIEIITLNLLYKSLTGRTPRECVD